MAYPLAFGPSELQDLGDVFDAAWRELLLTNGDELMDGPALRKLLAQRIMEAAENGETDPQRLKDYALRGVLGPGNSLRSAHD